MTMTAIQEGTRAAMEIRTGLAGIAARLGGAVAVILFAYQATAALPLVVAAAVVSATGFFLEARWKWMLEGERDPFHRPRTPHQVAEEAVNAVLIGIALPGILWMLVRAGAWEGWLPGLVMVISLATGPVFAFRAFRAARDIEIRPVEFAAGLVVALRTAIVTGLTGAVFYLLVRDDPPGRPVPPPSKEGLGDIMRGLMAVWKTPHLSRILAVHTFAYASQSTVLGLWGGPYLHDIHGLDAVGRGNVLLAMGAAQIAGILSFGPLDRLFNTRKWLVAAGSAGTISVLMALALLKGPPAWLAIFLLVLLCYVTTYSLVIVAHGRSLFPDHLAGRGITTVNLAQVFGCAFLPVTTGAIVNAFPNSGAGYAEDAYRLAFGFIALCLALGCAWYLGGPDSKPRPLTPR